MKRRGPAIKGAGLAVRRVEVDPDAELDPTHWPLTVPAVARLAQLGLDLGPATVLVGENGSGKSTLVEAIATEFGMNPEGGSTHARHSTRASESPLHRGIRLAAVRRRARGGDSCGPRRCTACTPTWRTTGVTGCPAGRKPGCTRSATASRSSKSSASFNSHGLYVLDEPESALSFSGCLALVGALHDLVTHGSQIIVATHSPVVAALPGATHPPTGPRRLDTDRLGRPRPGRPLSAVPGRAHATCATWWTTGPDRAGEIPPRPSRIASDHHGLLDHHRFA